VLKQKGRRQLLSAAFFVFLRRIPENQPMLQAQNNSKYEMVWGRGDAMGS
jgi:hypothetical protein